MRDLLAIFMALMTIVPLAYSIDYSITGDSGSASTSIDVGIDDKISSATTLSQDALQNSISGSGNLKENYSVRNLAGYEACAGVDVIDAGHYVYSYAVNPGDFRAAVRESLDVDNAREINAYALAKSAVGQSAGSKLSIENGSLKGYSNEAEVDDKISTMEVDDRVLSTYQRFIRAEGDSIHITSWGQNNITRVEVDTTVHGHMLDHMGQSLVTMLSASTNMAGHVSGSFDNQVIGKHTSKDGLEHVNSSIRRSSYGIEYDLNAGVSHSSTSNESIYNRLTYYVDAVHPESSKIQGAIDVAKSGDGIKISEGRYHENLNITKTLLILGAGVEKTAIDGDQKGSVITVGKDASVYLSGVLLRNGQAKEGGAIRNEGNLLLDNYRITQNTAKYGGAIYNAGNLALVNGSIDHNTANQDGGGIYNKGKLSIAEADITHNEAKYGGGVYNKKEGIVQRLDANVSYNYVYEDGGGIWNQGAFLMVAGNITANKAAKGAGICNSGFFLMDGGQIKSNLAYDGAGVWNKGNFTICNGSITNNEALNRGGAIYNDGGSVMLAGGDISNNRAKDDGGIHSTYNFRKKGIKGNRSIVHDNQNGDIGWHRNKKLFVSVICGVIAAVILIAILTVLTVGIAMYIATASTTVTGAAASAAASAAATHAAIAATESGGLLGAAVSAATTAAVASAGTLTTALSSLITAIKVIAVAACVGLALLAADALAWSLGMHFTL